MNKYIGKKTLIVVESPFQLLCAYEAIAFFQVDYDLYIRLSDSESTNIQMKNIVKYLNISDVKYIYFTSKKDFFTKLKMLKFAVLLKFKAYDYYFLGNCLSGFLHLFIKINKNNKIVLLDDGVATFKIQRELQKRSLPLTLFTIFNIKELEKQKIYSNEFSKLKRSYTKIEKNYDIFIGGKLVDLNIVTMQIYLNVIKTAIKSSKDNKLFYFPHRETSKEVIQEIESLQNLEIIYLDVNIEFYLLKEGISSRNIYSIMSTALFSLSILFKDANVVAYKPDFNKNEREEDIKKIYEIIQVTKHIEVKTLGKKFE